MQSLIKKALDVMEAGMKLQMDEQRWKPFLIDTLWAIASIFILTLLVFLLKAYPSIPDSFMLYILAILALAILRGFYPALLASFLAFFAFDFFFVPPLYSLAASKLVDVLALVIFLVTALVTSRLASALRRHADLAVQREQEARMLYDFARLTNGVEDVEQAMTLFTREIVTVFASSGIYTCTVALPDGHGDLRLFSATRSAQIQHNFSLSSEERSTIMQVLNDARVLTIDVDAPLPQISEKHSSDQLINAPMHDTSTESPDITACSKRLIPLRTEQKVIGVVCLLIDRDAHSQLLDQGRKGKKNLSGNYSVFFSAFLEQAVALIERGRLHQENMRVKLLQETDTLRSALLSSVSHDLRTPLSTIKASATSLLEEDVNWDEEARHSFVSAIERETNRLNRLVENLLDMSRIEAGALHIEKVWYPLDELIHDVLDRMQERLHDRPIETHLAPDLPPVELDYVQIDQVVSNLLDNALSYTPAGSPIELSAYVQDDRVRVDVADRGPGINDSERKYIFDKFYRVLGNAHKYGHTPGSGLGLAICRGIVEAHGGQIWFEPREGGGSIFCFTLPLRKIEVMTFDG
jgi:two-component system, OmpR family, sensor histidine kinase KdpD